MSLLFFALYLRQFLSLVSTGWSQSLETLCRGQIGEMVNRHGLNLVHSDWTGRALLTNCWDVKTEVFCATFATDFVFLNHSVLIEKFLHGPDNMEDFTVVLLGILDICCTVTTSWCVGCTTFLASVQMLVTSNSFDSSSWECAAVPFHDRLKL